MGVILVRQAGTITSSFQVDPARPVATPPPRTACATRRRRRRPAIAARSRAAPARPPRASSWPCARRRCACRRLLQHPHGEHAHGHGGRRPPGRRIGRRSAVDDRPVAGRLADDRIEHTAPEPCERADARQLGVHREAVGRHEITGTQHAVERREDQHRALGAPARIGRERRQAERLVENARVDLLRGRRWQLAQPRVARDLRGEPRGHVEQREGVPLPRDPHEPVEDARPRPRQLLERGASRSSGGPSVAAVLPSLGGRRISTERPTGRARWRCGTTRSAGRP